MTRRRVTDLVLALFGCAVGAGASPQPAAPGVVVESVNMGYAGKKPGVLPGDVLISWERRPNPPASPVGSTGSFRTPFDIRETSIHQAPRARMLTLTLARKGRRMRTGISELSWEIETRPGFEGTRLAGYEQGTSLIAQGDLAKGSDAWRVLADELSSSGDPLTAAWVWQRIAMKQAAAKSVDAAVASMDLAIAQARVAGRADVEAQLWAFKGGEILAAAKRFKEGEAALRQSLVIREREEPDSLAVADSLTSLNWVTEPRGVTYEAEQSRALHIAQRLAPGSALEANIVSSIGTVIVWRGDLTTGLAMTRRSLAIFEELDPHSRYVVFSLNSLCATEQEGGDLATADSYCTRLIAEARWRPTEEQPGWIAVAHHNMALIAQSRGDLESAASLLRKALAIREKSAPGSRGIAVNLEHLGLIEMRRGNLAEAEKLIRQAGVIQEAVAQLNSPYRAFSLLLLAEIAFLRRDLPAAVKQLRAAAAFWEPLAPNGPAAANVYDDLGQVLAELGETREAEVQFRRALENRRRSSSGGTRLTAESSHNLGMLLWKTGRLTEAEAELRRSIEDLEAQHSKLGGSAESRSSFTAEFADYYKDYLRLLVELKRQDDAFLLLERFRAGSFLRTLAQREITAPQEVPTDLERERRSTNAEYDRVQHEIGELNPATHAGQLETALSRLGQLRQEQSEIAEAVRKASPRYGSLRYPQPLDVAGARTALAPGTLLLSFAVGTEKTYLFALPGGAGGSLSVYTLAVGEKELRASVDAFRRLIQWNKPSPDMAIRSRALYRTLLEPAQELIARGERLLIVADGPLHKLPWAALARNSAGGRPQFLAEWRRIHTAPSVTVYAELQKVRKGRSSDPSVVVAAFGDPKYPQLRKRRAGTLRSDGEAGDIDGAAPDPEIVDWVDPQLRSVTRGGFDFAPLPESRTEVTEIAELYSPRAAVYLGADATEENAASIGRDVPLIHYACHAVVNERFPLDSALVFTIPDRRIAGRDNGLLQAWEIFERVRIDADLVTLSACDSGLGKEIAGEGLIGLTRAFQFAGARSVLASLWKVDDKSTAELMKRFYTYLKAGKSKDDALRLAQIDLIRSPEFSQPKQWAAFQLNGDWK